MGKVGNALDSIVIFLINHIPEERLNRFVNVAQNIEFKECHGELARNAIHVANIYVDGVSILPYAELYKKPGLSDRVILGLYRNYRNLLKAGNTQTP